MPLKLLTMDGFRNAARDGDAMEDAIIVRDGAMASESSDDSRTYRFIFSDGSVDRMGDTIDPTGWDLTAFKKNPVVLAAHDSSSISAVIGTASNVGVKDGELLGDIKFVGADINPLGEMAYRMVEAGILGAVSVGFRPLEYAFSKEKGREWGVDFKKQELVEISLVPVPANANALLEGKGVDLSEIPGMSEMAERIIASDGTKCVIPRTLLEKTFRDANTPRAVRLKYLAPAQPDDVSTWKCAAAKNLQLNKADTWDGRAAAERVFSAAGFDGDTPDIDMARRGFLVYDSANPHLKTSYQVPFCDIVDGELTAISAGISKAFERLPHAQASAAVISAAQTVLEDYIPRIIGKAGKKVSAANQALLSEAMDHHTQATECLKKVMASNDGPDMEGDHDPDDMPFDPMMDGKVDVSRITADRIEDAVERAASDAEQETEIEEAAAAATAAAEAAEVARQLRIRLAGAKHTQAMAALTAE